jgi:hypothetical protein
VLVKKGIALGFCRTDLINDYVAVVPERALLLPLCRRPTEAPKAHPARVEEVLRTVPRIAEELLGKRPGFAAHLALPPGQVRLARIQFCSSSGQNSASGFSLFNAPASLGDTLPFPV